MAIRDASWCCTRCWYNERYRDCQELGKRFTSIKDKDGTVEVFFDDVWAGMCSGLVPVCPNKEEREAMHQKWVAWDGNPATNPM